MRHPWLALMMGGIVGGGITWGSEDPMLGLIYGVCITLWAWSEL